MTAQINRRPHVLIVEDNSDIAELITYYLSKAGYDTEVLTSGTGAIQRIQSNPPNVVILDLMLPGQNGLEICSALRATPLTESIPLIMVTAKAEETDRISGLEIGADDYITKPFSPKELVARVGALLRRTQSAQSPEPIVNYGPLKIDLTSHTVTNEEVEVQLTAKEFLLLCYLIEHQGRLLSRDILLTDVWGYRYTESTRTVDVHVRRLREKLPILVDNIETIKQFGYRLVPYTPPLPPKTT